MQSQQAATPTTTSPAVAPQQQAQVNQQQVIVSAPTQPSTQQTTQPQAQRTEQVPQQQGQATASTSETPAAGDSKLGKGQQFNALVAEVNTILDGAMGKLEADKVMFKKAKEDGSSIHEDLAQKASTAREEAKGNPTQIEAIETHLALETKDHAKAFINFASDFRERAKNAFWKAYHAAENDKAKLSDLFEEITSHVGHAVKAMEADQDNYEDKFSTKLKEFYKARYSCKAKTDAQPAKDKDGKKVEPDACVDNVKTAKKAMKDAQQDLATFKENLKTAHHHGRKLRKGLQKSLNKLRYVFQKARTTYRHRTKEFHAGYTEHYSAQKSISKLPLRKLAKEEEKESDDKDIKEEKGAVEEEKEDAEDSSEKEVAGDTVKKAEIKAVKMVTKAAKAILDKKQKDKEEAKSDDKTSISHSSMVETSDRKKHIKKRHSSESKHHKVASKHRHHAKKLRHANKHHSAHKQHHVHHNSHLTELAQRKAEKKAVIIVKDAILRAKKSQKHHKKMHLRHKNHKRHQQHKHHKSDEDTVAELANNKEALAQMADAIVAEGKADELFGQL